MELEKTLFRVHEKILSYEHARSITFAGILIYFSLALISFIILISANIHYENKQTCPQYLKPQTGTFSNETLYQIFVVDSSEDMSTQPPSLVVYMTGMRELLYMNEIIRDSHNFSTEQIFIPKTCYFGNIVSRMVYQFSIGLEPILYNDILATVQNQDIYVRNNETFEVQRWQKESLQSYRKTPAYLWRALVGLAEIFKINLALFIQSAIASLYIKMTILCAPVFIIAMIESLVLCRDRQINPQLLFRAFPWMGVYMNMLDQSQHRTKKFILIAFLMMLVLFYFLYLSTVYIGTLLLFYKPFPRTLDENFFGFLAIIEFASMLFFRSRTSIYFAPKFITLYQFIFLFYLQYVGYGFMYLAFSVVVYATLGTLFLFLYSVEIKSLHWNTNSHYTPTLDRPRCFYTPIFQLGWVNDIPQIWTMFYPLYGRSYFTAQQLSYVDKNYLLLNNVLNQVVDPEQRNPPEEFELADFQQPQPQVAIDIDPMAGGNNQLRNNLIQDRREQ